MSNQDQRGKTIAALYDACVRELADVEAYRSRLLGRADTLRELCAAGLKEMIVAQGGDPLPLPEEGESP